MRGIILVLVLFYSCSAKKAEREYFDSGELKSIYKYLDDTNCIKEYYYKNGQLETALPIANGLIEGEVLGYYDTGELYSEVLYHKNRREGSKKYFYKDGSVKAINLFKGDSLYYIKSYRSDGNGYSDQVIPIIILDSSNDEDSLTYSMQVPFQDGFTYLDESLRVNFEVLAKENEGQDLPSRQVVFSKKNESHSFKILKDMNLDVFGLIQDSGGNLSHYFRKELPPKPRKQ